MTHLTSQAGVEWTGQIESEVMGTDDFPAGTNLATTVRSRHHSVANNHVSAEFNSEVTNISYDFTPIKCNLL